MRIVSILLILLNSFCAYSQKIHGKVFSENGDIIPYASVVLKGTTTGVSANSKGYFSINLAPGNHALICQSIGFENAEKQVLNTRDTEIVFILKQLKLTLKEVTVTSNAEDPAYEIIRQAIKKRTTYQKQLPAFSCELYAKDMISLQKVPGRIFGKKIKPEDKKELGVDSTGKGIIYFSESISNLYKQAPDKFKMNVISSRVSGTDSYGFTFPVFISLYTNNVKVFAESFNPRGFISPIADNAIHYYKFKFLGTFWENGKAINTIKVTPRRKYEPLFTGIINITDGDWRIHSYDLVLTKTAQLEIIDTLQIKQMYVPVNNDIWSVKNQLLSFNFNFLGIGMAGNFMSVFSDYKLNPEIDKKFFDRVIIHYDTASNKRNKNYWDSVRPVPLEIAEANDYKVKDSLFAIKKDSIRTANIPDSIVHKQRCIKPLQIFWNGINRLYLNKNKVDEFGIESLIKNMEYNSVEGWVAHMNLYLRYTLNTRSILNIEPVLRYGFNNEHFTAYSDVSLTNKKTAGVITTFEVSGGNKVSAFNNNTGYLQLFKNSISTLFNANNFLKIYQEQFGSFLISKRYLNGLQASISGAYENRVPLENTTTYTITKTDKNNFTPNYPEILNQQFMPHKALSIGIHFRWKPGQRYIQFPDFMIPLRSKFPTFTFDYVKGIRNILGSDVDYDKWAAGIIDTRNMKLAGELKYKFQIGGFINSNQVYIQDFQHFNGNPTRSASEYVNSFQLASQYSHSSIASFYSVLHIEHHLGGLLTNKIPLIRQLKWNLVTGTNAFFVNKDNNYLEVFAGIENIFKVLRVDFIAGYQNGNNNVTGIRIGKSGIGGQPTTGKTRKHGNSVSITF